MFTSLYFDNISVLYLRSIIIGSFCLFVSVNWKDVLETANLHNIYQISLTNSMPDVKMNDVPLLKVSVHPHTGMWVMMVWLHFNIASIPVKGPLGLQQFSHTLERPTQLMIRWAFQLYGNKLRFRYFLWIVFDLEPHVQQNAQHRSDFFIHMVKILSELL